MRIKNMFHDSNNSIIMLFFSIILILGVLLGIVFFSEKPSDVAKYSQLEEWRSYKITGICWAGCSKGDFYMTKFVATNKNGKTFEGCTCSGLFFKNITLRVN